MPEDQDTVQVDANDTHSDTLTWDPSSEGEWRFTVQSDDDSETVIGTVEEVDAQEITLSGDLSSSGGSSGSVARTSYNTADLSVWTNSSASPAKVQSISGYTSSSSDMGVFTARSRHSSGTFQSAMSAGVTAARGRSVGSDVNSVGTTTSQISAKRGVFGDLTGETAISGLAVGETVIHVTDISGSSAANGQISDISPVRTLSAGLTGFASSGSTGLLGRNRGVAGNYESDTSVSLNVFRSRTISGSKAAESAIAAVPIRNRGIVSDMSVSTSVSGVTVRSQRIWGTAEGNTELTAEALRAPTVIGHLHSEPGISASAEVYDTTIIQTTTFVAEHLPTEEIVGEYDIETEMSASRYETELDGSIEIDTSIEVTHIQTDLLTAEYNLSDSLDAASDIANTLEAEILRN